MKTQTHEKAVQKSIPIIKVGASRQVAIPKKIYDELELSPGDYMEISVQNNNLVLTPKVFIEKRLAEGLKDIKEGRTVGPFDNAKDAIKSLHD